MKPQERVNQFDKFNTKLEEPFERQSDHYNLKVCFIVIKDNFISNTQQLSNRINEFSDKRTHKITMVDKGVDGLFEIINRLA